MAIDIGRREFIAALGGAAAWPLAARAQSVSKMPRIGIIDPRAIWAPLRQGLRDLGYVEGRNIAIEYRSAEGRLEPERLRAAATELTRLPVGDARLGRIGFDEAPPLTGRSLILHRRYAQKSPAGTS
jgi:putative ABC transport system substrate-binding protein